MIMDEELILSFKELLGPAHISSNSSPEAKLVTPDDDDPVWTLESGCLKSF